MWPMGRERSNGSWILTKKPRDASPSRAAEPKCAGLKSVPRVLEGGDRPAGVLRLGRVRHFVRARDLDR